jgi:hypothetical protein
MAIMISGSLEMALNFDWIPTKIKHITAGNLLVNQVCSSPYYFCYFLTLTLLLEWLIKTAL